MAGKFYRHSLILFLPIVCFLTPPTTAAIGLCDLMDDLCVNGDCENNGTENFICHCHFGWTGMSCGEDVDECHEQIHQCVHGSCNNTDGNYTCNCQDGYEGHYCNQEIVGDNQYSHAAHYPVNEEYRLYVPKYYDAHGVDPNDPFNHVRFVGEGYELMGTTYDVKCIPDDIVCNTTTYRSFDGTCNNLNIPIYGAANTAQSRFLDPEYADGISQPRHVDGLRSPREISNALFDATHNQHFSERHTTLLMGWGQFFCHDIALTMHVPDTPEDCCNETINNHTGCFPFSVPGYDPVMTTHCLHFVRSKEATRGCLPDNGHREQNNEATSYIDLSMVYGNSEADMLKLRNFTGGKLIVKMGNGVNMMMPEKNETGFECKMNETDAYCQLSGDVRIDDAPHLGITHLLLVREHNRIVGELAVLNPSWDDDKLFFETRKILIAIFQHITFNEWLPEIIGESIATSNNLTILPGFWDNYDETINPSVKNEFIAAALRMGHSMIPAHQAFLLPDRCLMDWYSIVDNYVNSQMLYRYDGANLTNFMRWYTWEHSMKTDRFFETEARDFLFKREDLPSRNIQRGRDHGIPGYNRFREFCGFQPVDFSNYVLHDHDYDSSEIIKSLYRHADDVDLYAGAISETPRGGSTLGPTFTCLFAKQLYAFRRGDRLWYERQNGSNGFTSDQLDAIKKVTLSSVICANFDLFTLQPSTFRLISPHDNTNGLLNCTDIPPLNVDPWFDL